MSEMFDPATQIIGAYGIGAVGVAGTIAGAGAVTGGAAWIGGGIAALIAGGEAADVCMTEYCQDARQPDSCCSSWRAFLGMDPYYDCCLSGDPIESTTSTR